MPASGYWLLLHNKPVLNVIEQVWIGPNLYAPYSDVLYMGFLLFTNFLSEQTEQKVREKRNEKKVNKRKDERCGTEQKNSDTPTPCPEITVQIS